MQESQREKDSLDNDFKTKLENEKTKQKKDLKTAAEKARAELKNATDAVKNEMARMRAEMELSKKKLITDHTNELS